MESGRFRLQVRESSSPIPLQVNDMIVNELLDEGDATQRLLTTRLRRGARGPLKKGKQLRLSFRPSEVCEI